MSDVSQTVINWVFAALSAGFGFLVRVMWESVKDLQRADKELTAEVSAMKVLVAGNYITRDEQHTSQRALFAKLDRIEEKLDGKADKAACQTTHGFRPELR